MKGGQSLGIGGIMSNIKLPLLEMFDLLSREKELLVTQISEESNARKRSELNLELKNVSGILSDITASQ